MRKQNFIYGAVCVMAAAGTLCLAPGILNGMGKGEKQISSKTVQTADLGNQGTGGDDNGQYL